MGLRNFHHAGEGVHHHGHCSLNILTHGHCQSDFIPDRLLRQFFSCLAFLAFPSGFVLHGLAVDAPEGVAYGHGHLRRFSQTNNRWMITDAHCNLRNVAVLGHGKNYVGVKIVA